MGANTTSARWSLRHAWTTASDREALRLCAAALREEGIAFLDAEGPHADAIKMHGMELVEARARGGFLHDLRETARADDWEARLPDWVRAYQQREGAWFGIPVGVHQSNWLWMNERMASRIDRPLPSRVDEIEAWLAAAQAVVEAPLAVGEEPWQVGVVLESLVLAHAGAELYRAAFVELDRRAWRSPVMEEAVDRFLSLRRFVGERALHLGWQGQLERVRSGAAALVFMGDWVRCASRGLVGRRVQGSADVALAVIDFFVPLAAGDGQVARTVAGILTRPEFQRAFAQAKGCTPAFSSSDPAMGRSLPSLTFEQCCPRAERERLLDAAAVHFLRGWPTHRCIAALAGAAA